MKNFVSILKITISVFSTWAVGYLTAVIVKYGIDFEYTVILLLYAIVAAGAGFSAYEDMYDEIEEEELE